jgi:uncharacterized protein with HEPN domain
MSFEPRDYLRHILEETDYLLRESTDLTVEEFLGDETLRRAFVRSLEVIGEAANNVPDEYQAEHPELEWRLMTATRNRLIHGYFGVDYELVWDVVKNRIPNVRTQVRSILEAEQ